MVHMTEALGGDASCSAQLAEGCFGSFSVTGKYRSWPLG